MKCNYGYREIPTDHPMPPEMQAQYDRRMAQIKAAERAKYPELVELGRLRRQLRPEADEQD